MTDYAKTAELPTELPANGGNSNTVNNHTVESNVPVDAKFTDTVYDDTEVKGSIAELSSSLDTLEYGDTHGGKNIWDEQWENGVYNESDGIFSPISNYFCSKNKIKVKPNTIYRFVSPEIYHYIYKYDVNGNYIDRLATVEGVFSTDNNVEYIQFVMETDYGATYNHDIAIIEGTSGTYEPYIPSIKMLADEVSEQNESLSVIGKCKNLLNPTLETTTANGITCTNNGDGTYTLNGTQTDPFYLTVGSISLEANKKYKLTGCQKNGSWETYSLRFVTKNYDIISADFGDGCFYKPSKDDKVNIVIYLASNDATFNNLVFKPMITTDLNATYDDFVPYTGDGETLTHDVANLSGSLAPKKIELQNVDERVTIQDNGSFIINGVAFVNLLVTFKETLQQWSNFVRLPRPKGGNVTVYCENLVKLTIYSQDNLPEDCGTFDIVQSGTEIRLLVNYEVA